MVTNNNITESEKKLLQAQRRLDAMEARNRKKERSQRTRRLIQIGAILESIIPEIKKMELDQVKEELERRYKVKVWK